MSSIPNNIEIKVCPLVVGKVVLGYRIEFIRKNSPSSWSIQSAGWGSSMGEETLSSTKLYAVDINISLKEKALSVLKEIFSIEVENGSEIGGCLKGVKYIFEDDVYLRAPEEAINISDFTNKLKKFETQVPISCNSLSINEIDKIVKDVRSITTSLGLGTSVSCLESIYDVEYLKGSYCLAFKFRGVSKALNEILNKNDLSKDKKDELLKETMRLYIPDVIKVLKEYFSSQEILKTLTFSIRYSVQGWFSVIYG